MRSRNAGRKYSYNRGGGLARNFHVLLGFDVFDDLFYLLNVFLIFYSYFVFCCLMCYCFSWGESVFLNVLIFVLFYRC